jgi:hypothetical protein
MMAQQFTRHGVTHMLKIIENGEHGLAGGNSEQIKDAYASMREFVVRHLQSD